MINWRKEAEKLATTKKRKPQPFWSPIDAPFCAEDCYYAKGGTCTLWHGEPWYNY